MIKHGMLESAIMNVLWELEEKGTSKNSVKDVYEALNEKSKTKKAYTTIKTVMDRLYQKNMLIKTRHGRRFYYKTTYTNQEAVISSLYELANKYCNGDVKKLSQYLNCYTSKNETTSVHDGKHRA